MPDLSLVTTDDLVMRRIRNGESILDLPDLPSLSILNALADALDRDGEYQYSDFLRLEISRIELAADLLQESEIPGKIHVVDTTPGWSDIFCLVMMVFAACVLLYFVITDSMPAHLRPKSVAPKAAIVGETHAAPDCAAGEMFFDLDDDKTYLCSSEGILELMGTGSADITFSNGVESDSDVSFSYDQSTGIFTW